MDKFFRKTRRIGYNRLAGYSSAVFILVAATIFIWSDVVPWEASIRNSNYSFYATILEPLFFASAALSLSLLVLYFLPKVVFDIWWKFAVVYIPVCVLLFVLLADSGGGFGIPSFTPPDGTAMFFSALYLIITLGIIIVGLARAKGK